ncbi:MAG: hypothetical protein K2O24_00695 [Muribaculaceae bacterium]|nr:hypothetical protein [Muribaculaceae bacterium]
MIFSNRIKNPVIADLADHWKVLAVLVIGMIPELFTGYGEYFFILLLPLAFRFNLWTTKSYWILAFSILYLANMIQGGISMPTATKIFYIFFPILLAQTGAYLGSCIRYPRNLVWILAGIIVCLASTAIVSNINDTLATGMLINPMREVLTGGDKLLAATNYGMMLSLALGCTGLLLVPAADKSDRRLKTVLLAVGVFAIFCTVHLLNRTGLALVLISMIVGLVLQPFTKRRLLYLILVCCVLGLIYWIFLNESDFMSEVVQKYIERNKGGNSVSSMSGRDVRMAYALEILARHPEGGVDGIIFMGRGTYAHNLWIDAGLKGGWICMAMLVYFAIGMCRTVWQVWRRHAIYGFNNFETMIIVMMGVTFIAQSMSEPIIDGLARYFWFMLFFWSMLSSHVDRVTGDRGPGGRKRPFTK